MSILTPFILSLNLRSIVSCDQNHSHEYHYAYNLVVEWNKSTRYILKKIKSKRILYG